MIPARTTTPEPESADVERELSIERGLARFGASALLVGSGAIALSAAVYFIGWTAARAYYGDLNAAWLLPQCTAAHLLGFAWHPAGLLAFFAALALTDVFDSPNAWVLRSPATRFYIPAFLLLSVAGMAASSWTPLPWLPGVSGVVWLYIWVLMSAEAFVLLLDPRSRDHPRVRVFLTITLLASALYFVPTAVGRMDALRDADPKRSTLPCVAMSAADSSGPQRLLLAVDGSAYTLDLNPTGGGVRVVPLTSLSVKPSRACASAGSS